LYKYANPVLSLLSIDTTETNPIMFRLNMFHDYEIKKK
jgi:hypothetical protein